MQVKNLSGGELQRVAITLCLGKPADVYLIDEPSAYLDAEQRISTAKVLLTFLSPCSVFSIHFCNRCFFHFSYLSALHSRNYFPHDSPFPSLLQVIKRFIVHAKKTAFIVEHDFIMATYLADRVIVYTGEPGRKCTCLNPISPELFVKNFPLPSSLLAFQSTP